MNCQDCRRYSCCTYAKIQYDCNCPLFELKDELLPDWLSWRRGDMTCYHTLLRRTTLSVIKRIPVWECVDCGKIFDIEERMEES